MSTIRLVPSTYALLSSSGSSTSYLTISDASNMYTNTDSTTYATVQNTRTSTTTYYCYIRGFNFDDVPSGATVNSFSVKLKAYESGISTSSSYVPYLCNGTSTISGGSTSAIGTSAQVLTFSSLTADWETISGYGSSFGIRINCRRASRNTTGYMYIYGAEIEVDYTLPVSATVTSTLSGDGTISPSGATSTYDGAEYTLTITPTDTSSTVTVTNNGTDVTSSLVSHGIDASNVLGTYSLISGGFNAGEDWFQGIVGQGYDTTNTTTSNYYSSGSGTTAVFQYATPISIPSTATIIDLYMLANGHCESTSNSSEYMCVQLKNGSTGTTYTDQYNFKDCGVQSTNVTVTVGYTTLPAVSDLSNLVVECTLGYYGGAINGVTVVVEYMVDGAEYYTYTYTVSGDATIAVTISSSGSSPVIYVKENGSWVAYSKVYVKTNGSWVELSSSSWASLFDTNTNYRLKS